MMNEAYKKKLEAAAFKAAKELSTDEAFSGEWFQLGFYAGQEWSVTHPEPTLELILDFLKQLRNFHYSSTDAARAADQLLKAYVVDHES